MIAREQYESLASVSLLTALDQQGFPEEVWMTPKLFYFPWRLFGTVLMSTFWNSLRVLEWMTTLKNARSASATISSFLYITAPLQNATAYSGLFDITAVNCCVHWMHVRFVKTGKRFSARLTFSEWPRFQLLSMFPLDLLNECFSKVYAFTHNVPENLS